MKKLLYILLAIPLLITSCSDGDLTVGEQTVEVSFCAKFSQSLRTRATAANKVYCAVFENGEEICDLRTVVDVVADQPIVFAPRLIQNRSYTVAFWASKDGAYDVGSFKAITRIAGQNECDYDAFTATTEITVDGTTASRNITLKRPFAQLNIGVTEQDWNAVTTTYSKVPTTAKIKLCAKTSFNAYAGAALETYEEITYTLPISGAIFSVESEDYKSIASCYVLMNETEQSYKENFDIALSIYDGATPALAICEDLQIPDIPLQANYKTNIIGDIMTGALNLEFLSQNTFADN